MKKKSCFLVLILCAFFFIAGVMITAGMEHPGCDIKSLVLDEDESLKGWQRGDEELYPAFLPREDRLGAQQAFSNLLVKGKQEIGHTVYQYSNSWIAMFHMWFNGEIFFPSVGWEWSEMKDTRNLTLRADQVQIWCGKSNLQHLNDGCVAVIRYGPYISDFGGSVQEAGMSIEEFKRFVLKVDEMFSSCEK